jgi:urease accessory protein UreH
VAYGERWSASELDVLLAIEVGGAKLLHDRVVLHGDAAERMRRFEAIATAVLLGPRVCDLATAALERLGPIEHGASVIVAGSPLGDGALLRIAGDTSERVVQTTRAILRDACEHLGEDPWSRKW